MASCYIGELLYLEMLYGKLLHGEMLLRQVVIWRNITSRRVVIWRDVIEPFNHLVTITKLPN